MPVLLHAEASSSRLDHYRERNAEYCCGDSITGRKARRDIAFSQAPGNAVDARHVFIVCRSRGKHFPLHVRGFTHAPCVVVRLFGVVEKRILHFEAAMLAVGRPASWHARKPK
ncbi:MAG TPA: hypothetical protein VGE47_14755, partial [Burkholderiaceae bacterium]